jgi:hypothetical protein
LAKTTRVPEGCSGSIDVMRAPSRVAAASTSAWETLRFSARLIYVPFWWRKAPRSRCRDPDYLAVRVIRSEQSFGKTDRFGYVLRAARRCAEASVQQRTLLAGQKLIDVNDVFARVRARIGSMSREARYNRT